MKQEQDFPRRAIIRGAIAWPLAVCGVMLVAGITTLAADDNTAADSPKGQLVFVGSGTKDIHVFTMDPTTGALKPAGPSTSIAHPSFFTLSPNHHFLYAVTEGGSKNSSSVTAFSIEPQTGKLKLINDQPSGGAGPCHVAVDPSGRALFAANYSSGSMSVFPIKDGGALGPMSGFFQGEGSSVNAQRQEGPHAHCVTIDPGNRFALLCDLGLDKVFVFKFDAAHASIISNDPPFASVKAGNGPRHITFHPNGRFAYLINEMASTVTAFDYDASQGVLREIQTESTLPADFTGANTDAEVVVHPSGKFLYGSNRGHNSIVEFALNDANGRMTRVGWCPTQGKTPRNFEIDPTGTFLLAANQDSNSVVVFRIDASTGALTPTGQSIEVENPMCVKFCPL